MRTTRPARRAKPALDILEERLALAGGMAGAVVHHDHASAIPAIRSSVEKVDFPFENPILPEYPAIERLAQWVPDPTAKNPDNGSFQPVTAGSVGANNSSTTRDNVYVIAHGWAPGYLSWVEKIQKQKGNPLPLSWNTWQDKPGPSDGPVTPWLFEKSDTSFGRTSFPISDTGLAQQIKSVDPNATVLAFSWIDDSATTTGVFGVPYTPEHSEGNTTMDGMRMAEGIMQALAPNYYQGLGKVHLIGHSHGARVATEAALALQQAGKINPQFNVVGQLTLFDSPENNNASTNDRNPIWIDAANYDWFLLSQLNIARAVALSATITSGQTSLTFNNPAAPLTNSSNLVSGMGVTGNGIMPGTTITVNPTTGQVTLSKPADPAQQTVPNDQLTFSPPPNSIFVDSYNSYFGQDLGNFVVNDPQQGISNRHLNDLVDVKLVALNRAFSAFAFSNMHQYAANWYAGSVVTKSSTSIPPEGLLWSPLLPGARPVPASQYKQGWSYFGAIAANQFKLEPEGEAPVTPSFTAAPLTKLSAKGSVTVTPNADSKVTSVTLSSAQGKVAFEGDVYRPSANVGFSFNCNFTQVGDGSQLQILVGNTVYFAMSGVVADTSSLPGNASFSSTFGIGNTGKYPKITMRLVQPASPSGTPTIVTVSNFHEFTD